MSANAGSPPIDLKQRAFEPLQAFFAHEKLPTEKWPTFIELTAHELPSPSDYLLTQSLLTKAIKDHYKGMPQIQLPLQMDEDVMEKRYYRAVLISVNEVVVELGLITVNTDALPANIMDAVREMKVPFGALLLENNIKTISVDTRYFKTTCNQALAPYIKCLEGKTLYGRTNTIISKSDKVAIAHVVEILTGA